MRNSRFYGVAELDYDTRNVLILSPYIQTKENATSKDINFDYALVVDTDGLSSSIMSQLEDMINGPDAGSSKLLIEYLATKTFNNSERVLHWMQNAGVIVRVEAEKVRLTQHNGNMVIRELNGIIRKQMEDAEGSTMDVDQHHRQQAEQYSRELQESMEAQKSAEIAQREVIQASTAPTPDLYPDFGNPSERGDIPASTVPENEAITPDSLSPEVASVQAQTALVKPSDVRELHKGILSEIESASVRVHEAVEFMKTFEDTISPKILNSMVAELKNYGSRTSDDVKDMLIEVLSEHYDNVDADYIRRNLSSADRRLAKKESE